MKKIYDYLDEKYGMVFHLVFFVTALACFLAAVYLFTILIGMPV